MTSADSKLTIRSAIKIIREYDQIVPVDDHPCLYRYKDKDGYIYNYTIFILAEL